MQVAAFSTQNKTYACCPVCRKRASILLSCSHSSLSSLGRARLSVAVALHTAWPCTLTPKVGSFTPSDVPFHVPSLYFMSPLFRVSPGHLPSVHSPVLMETIGMCEQAIHLSASLLPVCFLLQRDTSLAGRVWFYFVPTGESCSAVPDT